MNIIVLALAGSVGALARFALAGAAERWIGAPIPAGTLVVNLLGSFGLGVLVGSVPAESGAVVAAVGFFGGFTTFSTWAIETIRLGIVPKPGRYAVINLAVMPALGVTAAAIGYFLAI